jgi:hypothetical protein
MITNVARIALGMDEESRKELVSGVLSRIENNDEVFNKFCVICLRQDEEQLGVSLGMGDVEGGVAHSTPLEHIVHPQVDGAGEDMGQWTPVVCRKKSKIRLPP